MHTSLGVLQIFGGRRWDDLISSGVKSGVASISRSSEIPDRPNSSLVNENNSDLFSLQVIFFVGVEYLLQKQFFIVWKHHWNSI